MTVLTYLLVEVCLLMTLLRSRSHFFFVNVIYELNAFLVIQNLCDDYWASRYVTVAQEDGVFSLTVYSGVSKTLGAKINLMLAPSMPLHFCIWFI